MMLKKRLVAGFLIFLIVIPLFVFGLEEEKTDCSGFFGSIKCFLWGDASNRAGMGWFDREGALVGMAGKIKGSCDSIEINYYCWDHGKVYLRTAQDYWKNVEVDPTTLELKPKGESFLDNDHFPGDTNLGKSSISVNFYGDLLNNAISAKADNIILGNQVTAEAKIQAEDPGSDQSDKNEAAEVASTNADIAAVTVTEIEQLLGQLNELLVVESLKDSAKDSLARAKQAEKNANLLATEISEIVYPSSPPDDTVLTSPADKVEQPLSKSDSTPASSPSFVYNPIIANDGTITVQGPRVLYKYAFVKDAKLGDKQVYQYSADGVPQDEWYVAEGDGLVRVIKMNNDWKYLKNDGTSSNVATEAQKSTLIGDEVKITITADGKVIIPIIAKPAVATTKEVVATPQPKYNTIFSDSLGDNKFSKKIKEKYFDNDDLKREYTFKDNQLKKGEEVVLIIKKETSGVFKVIERDSDTDGKVLSTSTHTLLFSGEVIASQTEAQKKEGKATINGNTVLMEESDQFITDDKINFAEQQVFYEDEEDKSNGVVKSALLVGDGKMTYTDADAETQTITDTATGEVTEWTTGDWDKDDKKFTPSKGVSKDSKGKALSLLDFDTDKDKGDSIEHFHPLSGDHNGITKKVEGYEQPVTFMQKGKSSLEIEYKGQKAEFEKDQYGQLKAKKSIPGFVDKGDNVDTFLNRVENKADITDSVKKTTYDQGIKVSSKQVLADFGEVVVPKTEPLKQAKSVKKEEIKGGDIDKAKSEYTAAVKAKADASKKVKEAQKGITEALTNKNDADVEVAVLKAELAVAEAKAGEQNKKLREELHTKEGVAFNAGNDVEEAKKKQDKSVSALEDAQETEQDTKVKLTDLQQDRIKAGSEIIADAKDVTADFKEVTEVDLSGASENDRAILVPYKTQLKAVYDAKVKYEEAAIAYAAAVTKGGEDSATTTKTEMEGKKAAYESQKESLDSFTSNSNFEDIIKKNEKTSKSTKSLMEVNWGSVEDKKDQEVILKELGTNYNQFMVDQKIEKGKSTSYTINLLDNNGDRSSTLSFTVDSDGNIYGVGGTEAIDTEITKLIKDNPNYKYALNEAKENEAKSVANKLKEEQDKLKNALEENKPIVQEEGEGDKAAKEALDSTTSGETGQAWLGSIYAASTSVKDYPAISKVLGISDWWKDTFKGIPIAENFVTTADQTFAPMLGTNWFPSALCESHWDIEPEGTAMIKTPTGTYQAVAHIEGERSASKSPILCQRNPDQEAEQEWLCDQNQVCLDNSFCYQDQDQNNKPDDEEKQLSGYFYKITWGVSAPSDETFTPFIDEDGVAVSFNVVIKNSQSSEPLYSKGADISGPIELKNGDSDRDVILHYSPNLYHEVCIEWENAPVTTPIGDSFADSFTGSFTGVKSIPDVCFDLVTSSVGEVNWESSGKPSSTKASDPKVSTNTGW